MKKLFLSCVVGIAATMCGCNDDIQPLSNRSSYNVTMKSTRDDVFGEFHILCDDKTDIAYLHYNYYETAGLTAYLDAEGKPTTCTALGLK